MRSDGAASSAGAPVAAFECRDRRLAGVQYHPEVLHSQHGQQVLENFLYEIAGCRNDKNSPRGTTNLGNYCNPKVDALADKIERETDQEARNLMIKQAYDIVMADWGYIPLHQQALAWGVSKKVKLVPRADNQMMLFWVSKEP